MYLTYREQFSIEFQWQDEIVRMYFVLTSLCELTLVAHFGTTYSDEQEVVYFGISYFMG